MVIGGILGFLRFVFVWGYNVYKYGIDVVFFFSNKIEINFFYC